MNVFSLQALIMHRACDRIDAAQSRQVSLDVEGESSEGRDVYTSALL
jgi:hypothetical protein